MLITRRLQTGVGKHFFNLISVEADILAQIDLNAGAAGELDIIFIAAAMEEHKNAQHNHDAGE